MLDAIKSISSLIASHVAAHADYAGPLGFVIAFCGCMIGTSLVVPAGAIATAVGVLIGAGVVSWTFVLWGICGAALGMSLSYGLGKWFGPRLLQMRVVHSRPELVSRVRALFARYGTAAILIAYYAGPPRALVASIAAIAGMPRRQFELANLLCATIWIGGAVLIGAIPGTLIAPESPWLLPAIFGAPAVVVVLTVVLLRRLF